MIEYAAFGFAVLVWWTWPALWAVVVTAVYGSYRLSAWQDRRTEAKQDRGPEPCLIHMGTDPDGFQHWCWLKDGHTGPHTNQWGVPHGDFDDDEPTDEEIMDIGASVMAAHPDVPWGEMQPPPGLPVPVLCLRSSNCYQPHDHPGQCILDYDHEASGAAPPAYLAEPCSISGGCAWHDGHDGRCGGPA